MQNIMGIPLAGSDVCGFEGNAKPELCTQWYHVGAFYPFSRNYNGLNYDAQEPYVFNGTVFTTHRYVEFIRNAMQMKLALVNYYYTEMSYLNEEGGAFYRPLFFDFPHDMEAYSG